jgi:hypothetical protein
MNLAGMPRHCRAAVVSVLGLLASVVCGCTTVAGYQPVSLIRVIDASYKAQALDAYVSTIPIAVNFGGPSISSYATLPPGSAVVKIVPTGKQTVLAQVNGTFLASEQHTVYITDLGTGIQAALLTDQNTAASAGFFSVRFLQQAISTGAVDIYFVPDGSTITDAKPVLSNVPAGTVTAYLNVPAGNYDVVVAAAGTTTGAYTSAATAFSSGQVTTMLIVDQQLLNTPPVNVLIANDVD